MFRTCPIFGVMRNTKDISDKNRDSLLFEVHLGCKNLWYYRNLEQFDIDSYLCKKDHRSLIPLWNISYALCKPDFVFD